MKAKKVDCIEGCEMGKWHNPKCPTLDIKPQHTPGPWNVSSKTFAGADCGNELAIHSVNGLVAMACTIHEGAINAEANARLIAAAPELLEALRALANEINLGKLTVKKDFGLMVDHAFALKVIAKAEGK